MFYTQTDRMFIENAERHDGPRVPLHNVDVNGELPDGPEEASPSSGSDEKNDGTWGERDIGGPVNFRAAMEDYESLRRELTSLEKTRTGKSSRSPPSVLRRLTTTRSRQSRATNANEQDVEAQEEEKSDTDEEDDFELGEFLKDGHFEKRQEGRSAKRVGVVYKNLTVQGVGSTATFVKTLPSSIIGVSKPFGMVRFPLQSSDADRGYTDLRPRLI
jgi:ATP-binding cassette, subfamily G (WHITE), member 2, SNQ2